MKWGCGNQFVSQKDHRKGAEGLFQEYRRKIWHIKNNKRLYFLGGEFYFWPAFVSDTQPAVALFKLMMGERWMDSILDSTG